MNKKIHQSQIYCCNSNRNIWLHESFVCKSGIPYSPFTGKPIASQTISQIVDKIKELPKKSTIYLYAPVVRGRKGEYKKDILNYKKRGFRKIKIDETLYEIDKIPELNKKVKHDISILVDRIVLNSSLGNRLAESIETSVNLSNGLIFIEYEDETLPKNSEKLKNWYFHKICLSWKWFYYWRNWTQIIFF